MSNAILCAANRALSLVLIIAIIGTGYLAIQMTHVSASVNIYFGQQPKQFDDAIDLSELRPEPLNIPTPQHKPKVPQ